MTVGFPPAKTAIALATGTDLMVAPVTGLSWLACTEQREPLQQGDPSADQPPQ
jgi:hypothetical protein